MRLFRPPTFLVRLSTISVLLLPLLACSEPPPPDAEAPIVHQDYNVVFILVDTLRADHLGAYGYERTTSPFFDQLAASSILFENARSQASCTFPSVNSILTSRSTFDFLGEETRPGIPEGIPVLPEILQQNGYTTLAVSASPIVRATPSNHNPVGGFGRGFDVFDERCQWDRSVCVTARGLMLVDEAKDPFFLYLHYMDPHDPFNPLPEMQGRFTKAYDGPHEFIANGDPNPIAPLIREKRVDEEISEGDIQHLVGLYDEEILSFDAGLRELFDGLEERGLLDKTLVVIASDHGEAFLEHGQIKHCYTVYDNETRVPLLLHSPRLDARRIGAWVQNLDITPTLLDYLGIPDQDLGMRGESLRPVIEQNADPGFAYSSMGPWRSVNDAQHKLVVHLGRNDWKLYDLDADPDESTDVLRDQRRIFSDLREALESWTLEVEGSEKLEDRLEQGQEIEQELRNLGYLG